MANGTQTPGQTFVRADGRVGAGSLESVWKKIKLVLVRSVFWSYERGSWQYDIICVVILAGRHPAGPGAAPEKSPEREND
ncbi:MAG: hypothetical protein DMG23_14985 [Acidobacteria bacterium]|nr:MAG: hypothetical protein DMG23_14985 [Acidobacteriota bacterium]